ncbi:gamma-tubulin complex component [Plakobranchus ocellatus]|uniref:Gamma-tubulin complex component n=1 Tax=Plakobranchus ocellatus TaxID=259542 RepID=A0AAV3XXB8_9GAST|nr:gamma-tubulin complex component [Plakobranchus ocellatus]
MESSGAKVDVAKVSSSQAKRQIAATTETPIEFFAKYDELKGKNVRDLDPLVHLLSKLGKEEEVKYVLGQNALTQARKEGLHLYPHQHVTSQLPAPGTKMTEEELSQVQDLLKQAKVVDTPADFLTKVLREKPLNRNVNLPQIPDGFFQHPHLTCDFSDAGDSANDENIVALGTLPLFSQEHLIMEDLLVVMRGLEGKYIRSLPLSERYAAREFLIDQSLDSSTRTLVQRILPMCANYSSVIRFIEEKSLFEYGLVNHALSNAMQSLIKDYMVLAVQLEQQLKTGQLTLQKMCFYLQPTMTVLDILASVSNSINRGKCIGGAVLSLLHEKTASMIGDSKSSELLLFLTQSACAPYMDLVEKWIYRGIIVDPYSEFMVEENELFNKEKLQEEYNDAYPFLCVFQERIPVFLEQVADKILNTGKYLNVVRQCGRDVRCPFGEDLVYTVKERRYYDQIERAYSYASQLLLSLLIEEKELMARLRSIKHYFLLDKGDFIVQFMDMTEVEMRQHIDDILPSRLESLLELALRTSTANVDPFKDDLRVDLLPFDLTSQLLQIIAIDSNREKEYRIDPTDIRLSGLESFTFDYMVKWPTSLVISRKPLFHGADQGMKIFSGRDVRCPFGEDLVYTVKERRYYDQIERAYSYASQLLLSLLIEEKELMARLRSIKHYFLLDKGDFIVQFMDMTEVEMRQHIDDILPSRLESLLELALRTSTANVDPFKDDLRVDLLPFDLTSQLLQIIAIDSNREKEYRIDPTDIRLSGLESFTFDYMVKWPTSLVISRKALIRYQILFRHLFYCKHVERQLCSIWKINMQAKAYARSRWYTAAFALRQRMLNFVQNFEYYMMSEVIEPNWHDFQQNMAKVSNVDEVLAFHGDFLDCCLKDCMLTSTELLRIVHKLLVVCVTFSNYVQVLAEHVDRILEDENFEQTIVRFDTNFSRHLLELLDKIMDENTKTYEHKLFNIIYRLDFNGFYTEQLEAMSAERAIADLSLRQESRNTSKSSSSSSLTSFTTQQPDSARYVPGQYKSNRPGSSRATDK